MTFQVGNAMLTLVKAFTCVPESSLAGYKYRPYILSHFRSELVILTLSTNVRLHHSAEHSNILSS
jgi:hypothetical protein